MALHLWTLDEKAFGQATQFFFQNSPGHFRVSTPYHLWKVRSTAFRGALATRLRLGRRPALGARATRLFCGAAWSDRVMERGS